jgi:RsiW-degrading membrane proteinase PrsW (M82 family)
MKRFQSVIFMPFATVLHRAWHSFLELRQPLKTVPLELTGMKQLVRRLFEQTGYTIATRAS